MAETVLSEAGMKSLEETMVILNELDITQQNEFVLSIVNVITKNRVERFCELKKNYGVEIDNYAKSNDELLKGLETLVQENFVIKK